MCGTKQSSRCGRKGCGTADLGRSLQSKAPPNPGSASLGASLARKGSAVISLHPLAIVIWLGLQAAAPALAMVPGGPSAPQFSSADLASVVEKTAILLILAGTTITFFRTRISQALRAAAVWLAIGLVLAAGYSYRIELYALASDILADLVPGHAFQVGATVEIARPRGGEFHVIAEVNGMPVTMVLDTGATAVVLTRDAARVAGLPVEMLSFTVDTDTANGRGRAAAVVLDRISVGSITERSVPALVAQSGQLKQSLLGMSFLNRLGGWEVRGDKLVMRGSP